MLVATVASISMADLISIVGSNKDAQVSSSGVTAFVGQVSARIGNTTGIGTNTSLVVPFLLPALTGGSTITGATLKVYVTNNTIFATNAIHMDILGGRVSTSPTVLASDWNYGAMLANNVANLCTNRGLGLNPIATNTYHTFWLDKTFFQNLYDTGNAGKIVFITLMADGYNLASTANSYTTIMTSDSTIADQRPTLNLYTIPEPATIGMLGLGALVTLLIRRIRS